MSTGDETRLPRWAQQELGRLRANSAREINLLPNAANSFFVEHRAR